MESMGEGKDLTFSTVQASHLDLRPPNVLLDRLMQHIKFIDFNWAGRFDPCLSTSDSGGVPLCIQDKIRKMNPSLRTPATRFPLNILLSTFNDHSLGLKSILPRHDWKMWRIHFCSVMDICDPDQILTLV